MYRINICTSKCNVILYRSWFKSFANLCTSPPILTSPCDLLSGYAGYPYIMCIVRSQVYIIYPMQLRMAAVKAMRTIGELIYSGMHHEFVWPQYQGPGYIRQSLGMKLSMAAVVLGDYISAFKCMACATLFSYALQCHPAG